MVQGNPQNTNKCLEEFYYSILTQVISISLYSVIIQYSETRGQNEKLTILKQKNKINEISTKTTDKRCTL